MRGGAAGAAAIGLTRFQPAFGLPTEVPVEHLFLLDRITFGYDWVHSSSAPNQQSMVQEIGNRGYMGFLDWQLGLNGPIDDSAQQAQIGVDSPGAGTLWNLAPLTPYEIGLRLGLPTGCGGLLFDPATIEGGSAEAVLLNGYRSRKQLQIVLADFWSTVHSTFLLQENQWFAWLPFFKRVLYDNVFGSYGNRISPGGALVGMLPDSARSGSMMLYLDQWQSDQTNPIENYARELLELHTVGVKSYPGIPSYPETDIAQVARVFTGWTMLYPAFQSDMMDFRFDPARHALGSKSVQVTNKTYDDAANGVGEGESLLLDLVQHPLTALHMSERLIHWFLGDRIWNAQGQPDELYDAWIRVALKFYMTQGDLRETVRELFDVQHLDQIWPGRYRKVRRPLDLVVALMRAAGPDYACSGGSWIADRFRRLSQVPGFWPAPNGYPADNAAWASSMRTRFEFLHDVVLTPSLGLDITSARLAQLFPNGLAFGELAERANSVLTGGMLPLDERNAVQAHLGGSSGTVDDTKRREAILMTLASPSYQFLF